MANFSYKAKNKENKTVAGVVQAPSEEMAVDILVDKGLTIFWFKETATKGEMGLNIPFLNRIPPKDIVIFSRQLSVLVSANVPLVQSLKTMIKQTNNNRLKIIVSELSDEVEGGSKLSTALGKYPIAFSNFYVNIIRSGETSGKLDEVLNYLADQQEKDYDLMSKIRGAMIYPAFILSSLTVVGMMMMIFVIPKLTGILQEANAELPLATRILIGVSGFLQGFWWLLLILFIGLFIGFQFFIKTDFGRRYWDLIKLKVPVVGNLLRKIMIVRFLRSLDTLITGGVSLPKSLRITGDVVGNVIFKELILNTVKEVEGGNPIASVFAQSKDVPYMVSQMMNIGEKTGKLDEVLRKLTDFYAREIDNLVRNLVTLVEPLVMVLMGLGVGLMVAAVILPMYNLASSV